MDGSPSRAPESGGRRRASSGTAFDRAPGTRPSPIVSGHLARLVLIGSTGLLAACSGEKRVHWAHAGIPRFEGRGAPTREQGAWSYWYPNGQLREQGEYEDGRRTGVWKQWFRNGQRASEGERRWNDATGASEREGAWTFWHENGQLRSRGTFVAGQPSGSWEGWDDAGEVDPEWTGTFRDGVKVP